MGCMIYANRKDTLSPIKRSTYLLPDGQEGDVVGDDIVRTLSAREWKRLLRVV